MFRKLLVLLFVSAEAFGGSKTFIGQTQFRSSQGSQAASALLEVNSTTLGALPCPKQTTTQINAISSPTEGLCAFNTSTHQSNYYDGSAWQALSPAGVIGVVSKTTTYTATTSDFAINVSAAGGAWTLTVYTPVGNTGKQLFVSHTGATNNVTLSPAAGTIGGYSTLILAPGDSVEIYSDGTNWLVGSWTYNRQTVIGSAQTSNGTTTSSSFAAPTNTLTASITPLRTAKFRVMASFVAFNGSATTNQFRINATAGSPTVVFSQEAAYDSTASGLRTPVTVWQEVTLTKGTAYTFQLEAACVAGTLTLNNAINTNGNALRIEELY
jgi:hypothetical protein